MNKLLYLAMIFISLKGYSQTVSKFRIDPDKAYGGTASEYFSSVEYIPLETMKESLFGDIWGMAVTDSSYVISDFDTKAIYFFALNGKFISKLNGTGNFMYDENKHQIVIYTVSSDETKLSLSTYNLQGKKNTI